MAKEAVSKRRANDKTPKQRAKPAGNRGVKTPPEPAEGTVSGQSLNDAQVEEALVTGEHRQLLEAYFGEEAYEELTRMATRARTARVRGGPRVLILPGIMGSKLGRRRLIFNDTIWIDPVDIIAGALETLAVPAGAPDIEPIGVILLAYLKLKLRLQLAGFDADFYPFDWRNDIAGSGAQLAERIREETSEDSSRKTVYLVAHSMGGLVSRAAIKLLDAEPEDASRVQRLIMLGTPNFGSFSPVQALSGNHSLVKKVAALDVAHTEQELVNDVFNTFLGLYQMLPAREKYADLDLYTLTTWPQTGIAPRSELLQSAPDIHAHLADGRDQFTLIAGVNQATIVGVRREGDAFQFSQSKEGDGTVPLAFAELSGAQTYYVEEEHGSLPNNEAVAHAVIDLIETGKTELLPDSWAPAQRGMAWEVDRTELTRQPFGGRTGNDISPRERRHLLDEFAAPLRATGVGTPPTTAGEKLGISLEPIIVGRRRQQRIDLRLAHGDIRQVDTRALVLGLYKDVAPTGAASAIDAVLGGAITEFSERRMLSVDVGNVFIMPANRYRTGADLVVFAGLGTYDDFGEEVLRLVAENVARALTRTKVEEFATVLLGAGSGLSSATVLANLVEGFLRGLTDGAERQRLRAITLCERDSERYASMHREMLRLSTTSLFDDVQVSIETQELPPMILSPVRSSRAQDDMPDPIYLLVREMDDLSPTTTDASLEASFTIRASVLSAGSKATVITDSIEVDGKQLNLHLEQIETREFGIDILPRFGAELARQVLPGTIQKALLATTERPLVVIHDARCSRIPWETINLGSQDSADAFYPAATNGLSRKYEAENLSVAKWLDERRLADELSVLLIVNPTLDLNGAEAEGDRIKSILQSDPAIRFDELRGSAATYSAVKAAFRSGRYDVIHYAGHAFFDPVNRARSGLLCHGKQVLNGIDMAQLERLPALVFFNACESGRLRSQPDRVHSERKRKNGEGTALRLETNIGLAESLLRAGVGNYVGTYWPVGDAAAKEFGRTFYTAITRGETIGKSLNDARAAVQALPSVDWADYVHYGSPGFTIKRSRT